MTLHYGDAENLKGFTEAAGFLPELMIRGTKDLTRQQIQDIARQELRPARHRHEHAR